MEKRNPKIEAEFSYTRSRNNGRDLEISRDANSRLMITTFTGDHKDLPKSFKRQMKVSDLDRFEEGDRLVLTDDYVGKLERKIEELEVVAGDDRQQLELDLENINENQIYCPLCGDIIWHSGGRQDLVSCSNCMVYFDFYTKGEQTVIEFGP